MSANMSREAWLAALGDAARPVDPDALTVVEIAEQFGIGPQAAYKRLKALIAAQKAVVTVKIITTSQGVRKRVPAYRLVTPARKK